MKKAMTSENLAAGRIGYRLIPRHLRDVWPLKRALFPYMPVEEALRCVGRVLVTPPLLTFIILLWCGYAHGQAVRFDPSNLTQVGQPSPSGMPPLFAIPNASISLCGYPANANPCTNFAPSYTDATATQQCNASQPVTWNGTSTCTSVADGGGSFGFWVAPGNYTYMVTTPAGQTYGPYVFSASLATSSTGGTCTGIGSCTITNNLMAASLYNTIYPAICQGTSKPTWCTGSTAGDFIQAACNQLPAKGGVLDWHGLTGNVPNQVKCSTPTKQVGFITDPTSPLTISAADGLITFPLDNGSWMIGPGNGGCPTPNGIHLTGTARVTAIVGPAHTDGTQESFTAVGNCLWGATGATVTSGLIYAKQVFANTTINYNNVQECNTACIDVENVGGQVNIIGNEANLTDGNYAVFGSPIIVRASGVNGCGTAIVNIKSGNAEHANGGGPELLITGDGAGALVCGVSAEDVYTERNAQGTPSTVNVQVSDCWGCNLTNMNFGGGAGTPIGDDINISETALGRVRNVHLTNVGGPFQPAVNTINDTTPGGQVFPSSTNLIVDSYTSQRGYQQLPPLPGNTLQALTADLMGGQGNFATGSGTSGTNFVTYGCVPASGVTCTYTRTNSTAPPGYTYSQQIQITSNTDPSIGFNGIQFSPAVSFTNANGQTYQVSFWAKGDGTYMGLPTFILGDSTVPTQFCIFTNPNPVTTTWTLYSSTCSPSSSGSSFLSFSTESTPVGATGTFYLAGLNFSPINPMPPGAIAGVVGPYGVGLTTPLATQTATCNAASKGNTYIVADVTTWTTGAAYVPGGTITAPIICSYNGSTYGWAAF